MKCIRYVSIILVIVFGLVSVSFQNSASIIGNELLSVKASETNFQLQVEPDRKVFSQATIYDEFADDTVIVTMTRKASLKLKQYKVNDFSEINLQGVRNLSTTVEEKVKEQLSINRSNDANIFQQKSEQQSDIRIDEFRQIFSLSLKDAGKENVLSAIRKLEQRDDVYAAEPNWSATPASLSNMRDQAAATRVNLPQTWNITTGFSSLTVGILDTGVDITHPDLASRLHPSGSNFHGDFTGSTVSPLVDNGFPHAWNGHGSHVAGIVGPLSAWDVRLASLRVFSTVDGLAELEYVLAAIDHAILRNIQILNYSGGSWNSAALEQKIRNFNGLFITSAGNDNALLTTSSNHIGARSIPNLIVVGASNSTNDNRATPNEWGYSNTGKPYGSNYGADVVDIFAPGTGILSTVHTSVNSSRYISWNGSSMAAPMVTGVAALLLSHNLQLNAAQIKQIIINSAYKPNVGGVNPLQGLCVSNGRLDAYNTFQWFQWLQSQFDGGSGTSASPFLISTPQQLLNISILHSSSYRLNANVNLGTISNRAMIHNFNDSFLRGNNRTIYMGSNDVPLFSTIINSQITEMRIENNITRTTPIIATTIDRGAIMSVTVIGGSINAKSGENSKAVNAYEHTGAFTAYASGVNFQSCYNYVPVLAMGYAGGYVGQLNGTGARFAYCYNYASITAHGVSYTQNISNGGSANAGGFIGQDNSSGTIIQSCTNMGTITAEGGGGSGRLGAAAGGNPGRNGENGWNGGSASVGHISSNRSYGTSGHTGTLNAFGGGGGGAGGASAGNWVLTRSAGGGGGAGGGRIQGVTGSNGTNGRDAANGAGIGGDLNLTSIYYSWSFGTNGGFGTNAQVAGGNGGNGARGGRANGGNGGNSMRGLTKGGNGGIGGSAGAEFIYWG
ncbi:MAG: S8 family serine peptidase [Firmicutes bacterium]|nr:S8 family serine peptidase [Bacillota bacterium]